MKNITQEGPWVYCFTFIVNTNNVKCTAEQNRTINAWAHTPHTN